MWKYIFKCSLVQQLFELQLQVFYKRLKTSDQGTYIEPILHRLGFFGLKQVLVVEALQHVRDCCQRLHSLLIAFGTFWRFRGCLLGVVLVRNVLFEAV